MQKKGKKPALTPEAAKILEQYRNASQSGAGGNGGGAELTDEPGAAAKPNAAPLSPSIRRSGTRGK